MKLTRSRDSLWKISVSIAPESEDAVLELLMKLFGQSASIYADTEKRTTIASIFVPNILPEHRRQLRNGLDAIQRAGLNVGTGRVTVRRIPRENWAESWKRHFKPLEINSKLLILPSWIRRRPKRGQAVVILDPGLSFGTGHHPTTSFCLEQIVSLRKSSAPQSLLDIGTGSGILSIAAAKLGYSPVVAFDFDPAAVRVAKENAAVNHVHINLSRQDLTKLPVRSLRRFDVICANLISDLLIQERRRVLGRLSKKGTLVLAGVLAKQFRDVRRAYESERMELVATRTEGEWRSGSLRFRP